MVVLKTPIWRLGKPGLNGRNNQRFELGCRKPPKPFARSIEGFLRHRLEPGFEGGDLFAQSLEGEAVQLERAGLSLPVLSGAMFEGQTEDELVARRLVELDAAEAMTRMRTAASQSDWATVDRLLEEASQRFAGNGWVAAVLEAMKSIAAGRERERMMKEAVYSSSKLRSLLSAKDEGVDFCAEEVRAGPAYLRRKSAQGKGDV